MSYTPNTWETGDTITAVKLNNMEQGIANAGVFYITTTWDDSANGFIMDKTIAQIETAYANGQLCMVIGEINSIAHVVDSPMGLMILIDPFIYVDAANHNLAYDLFAVNPQTGVISETEYLYTLTPAQ